MVKYLIEQKGADLTLRNADGYNVLELAVKCQSSTYVAYICHSGKGIPINVAELASSDEWGPPERAAEAIHEILAAVMKQREAAAQKCLQEQREQEAQSRKEKEERPSLTRRKPR